MSDSAELARLRGEHHDTRQEMTQLLASAQTRRFFLDSERNRYDTLATYRRELEQRIAAEQWKQSHPRDEDMHEQEIAAFEALARKLAGTEARIVITSDNTGRTEITINYSWMRPLYVLFDGEPKMLRADTFTELAGLLSNVDELRTRQEWYFIDWTDSRNSKFRDMIV